MRLGPLIVDARSIGVALCVVGFALLWLEPLWLGALGLECFAAAFWLWARASEHAGQQIARWSWLRRPATAMWLGAAIQVVAPGLAHGDLLGLRGVEAVLVRLEAMAVVWAGLELMAALPLARPFADVPGPLLAMRPWLPAVLPAAGFVVLWRHIDQWTPIPIARECAMLLLLITAWLGALRATGRKVWSAALRWLFVVDSAMAGMLVSLGAVSPRVALLLWVAACGGRAYLLAGELRGAAPRRGPVLSRLWRLAMSVASASLAWPVLVVLGFGPGGRARLLYLLIAAVPVALTAALTLRRHVSAPERRVMVRPQLNITLGHVMALITLVLGPTALLMAWWGGFEASTLAAAVALLPPVIGALAARPGREVPLGEQVRGGARGLFRFVIERERWLIRALTGLIQTLSAPLRDLHTGDAQEYLLFVMGVAVFALILPLLQ